MSLFPTGSLASMSNYKRRAFERDRGYENTNCGPTTQEFDGDVPSNGTQLFGILSRDFVKGGAISDTDSSDGDSLWSGSAPSSGMSSPSPSRAQACGFWMSSLSSRNETGEEGELEFRTRDACDLNPKVSTFSMSMIKTVNSPAVQPEYNTFIQKTAGKHVDYLSYEWCEEDLWASWRHVSANEQSHPKGQRLGNASWRAWGKLRSNLKTVTPESLNWMKDSDNTWLYGPFRRTPRRIFEYSSDTQPPEQSLRPSPNAQSLGDPPAMKPILKKPGSTNLGGQEVLLSRCVSTSVLSNQDICRMQVHRLEPTPEINTDSFLPPTKASSSAFDRGSPYGVSVQSKDHVRFSFNVEQCVVLEESGDGDDSDDRSCSSNYEGSTLAKVSRTKRAATPGPRGSKKSIGSLPPTLLKSNSAKSHETPSSRNNSCGPRKSRRLSSPPPPTKSRPKRRRTIFTFGSSDSENDSEDDDEDDDVDEDQGMDMQSNSYSFVGSNDENEDEYSPEQRSSDSNNYRDDALLSPEKVYTIPASKKKEDDCDTSDLIVPTEDPYSLLFKTAISKLATISTQTPSYVRPTSIRTSQGLPLGSQQICLTNATKDHLNSRVHFDSPISDKDPQRSATLPAYSVGLPPWSRVAEGADGDQIGVSLIESNCRATKLENEDEGLLFDMGDLNLQSTGTDVSQIVLRRRNRDWWFVSDEGVRTSNLDSIQPDFVPCLTQTPFQPSVGYESKDTTTEKLPMIVEHFAGDHPIDTLDCDMAGTDEYETATESYSDDWTESLSNGSLYELFCDVEGESNAREESLVSALNPMQQALVDRVMEEFRTIFDHNWRTGLRNCGGEPSNSSEAQNSGVIEVPGSLSPLSPRKRRRQDDEPPDGEKGKGLGGARMPTEIGSDPEAATRFACPFRKHDPRFYNVYSYKVCTLSHWSTIGRVKEHLYRSHRLPVHCKRCWHEFKSQDLLDAHLTVATSDICDLQPGEPPKGITSDQERRLRSRKKSSPNQSDEDRWRDIYKILFPNEEVPSPYFEPIQEETEMSPDSRELANYEDYIRRELPRVVRRNIEEAVRREMGPLESSLIGNLVGIVQDCQDMVFRSYRQAQGLSDELSPPPSTTPLPALPHGPQNELTVESTRNGQQSGLISTMFCAPPSQTTDSMSSTPLLDEVQSRTTTPSTNGVQSDADSGYASEQVQLCGCCGPCSCSSTHADDAMDTSAQEFESSNIFWDDRDALPSWDPLLFMDNSLDWHQGV